MPGVQEDYLLWVPDGIVYSLNLHVQGGEKGYIDI